MKVVTRTVLSSWISHIPKAEKIASHNAKIFVTKVFSDHCVSDLRRGSSCAVATCFDSETNVKSPDETVALSCLLLRHFNSSQNS